MKEFYFIRHGETDANLQGMMCGGDWDISLNANGLNQASIAAQLIYTSNLYLSKLLVSSMLRTRETAEVINASLGITVEYSDILKEWHLGSWDKVPFETVKEQFLGQGEPIGGESRSEFNKRVQSALKLILGEPSPILVVSHGAVLIAILEILDIPFMHPKNCEPIRIFELSDGKWSASKL